MKSSRVEGIIIKRKNYGEADRMITVFTKDRGKIQVKAVGIRRITSRRSSHVELLNHAVLGLYKGRTYAILTEAQTIENFSPIKKDLQKMGHAYHICELIDGLCPENQENSQVFFMLKNMLLRLNLENDNAARIRAFEIELLTTLGFWNREDILSEKIDTRNFIETILERKLKSCDIFAKLQ